MFCLYSQFQQIIYDAFCKILFAIRLLHYNNNNNDRSCCEKSCYIVTLNFPVSFEQSAINLVSIER